MTKITYVEPNDYFPKEIRKECGLGEFAETDMAKKKEEEEKAPANDEKK